MSTVPSRPTESFDASRAGNAVLGRSVLVKGQILSREDLTIDGEVEGTIEMQEHRLTIGPNGKVRASVKAREIIVLGTLHGNVETGDRIDIRKEAKLVGDIKTARIVIEDGAYFKGNVDITRAEVSKPAAAAHSAPAPRPRPIRLLRPRPPRPWRPASAKSSVRRWRPAAAAAWINFAL